MVATQTMGEPMKLCLFGASPDTPNLGVSALYFSVMNAIVTRYPDADITVFDHSRAVRRVEQRIAGRDVPIRRIGANMSRRYYSPNSLVNMKVSAALGGLGNPGVMAISGSDGVLDISGGDSFSDIYGTNRFMKMVLPKEICLRTGAPLVLLPQTYGPFNNPEYLERASRIVRGATMAFARDQRNYDMLCEMLGTAPDEKRHYNGVDVAFALPKEQPDSIPEPVRSWIEGPRERPVIGFNVSGLVYDPQMDEGNTFGFKADYHDAVHGILQRLLDETDARIVLIPHVLSTNRQNSEMSDTEACHLTARHLGADPDRLCVLDHAYNPMGIKWVISQLDFMCGTRMHATIAGLSSRVPTATIAYSKKALGVFESCGQGDRVADPRVLDTGECIDHIWQSWLVRDQARAGLEQNVGTVLERAQAQSDAMFDFLDAEKLRRSRGGASTSRAAVAEPVASDAG